MSLKIKAFPPKLKDLFSKLKHFFLNSRIQQIHLLVLPKKRWKNKPDVVQPGCKRDNSSDCVSLVFWKSQHKLSRPKNKHKRRHIYKRETWLNHLEFDFSAHNIFNLFWHRFSAVTLCDPFWWECLLVKQLHTTHLIVM